MWENLKIKSLKIDEAFEEFNRKINWIWWNLTKILSTKDQGDCENLNETWNILGKSLNIWNFLFGYLIKFGIIYHQTLAFFQQSFLTNLKIRNMKKETCWKIYISKNQVFFPAPPRKWNIMLYEIVIKRI